MQLELQLERVKRDLMARIYTPPTQGVYHPTLAIGLGGTGVRVLRCLKQVLQRHAESDIALLAIDSDRGENGKFPDLPKLSDTELLPLESRYAISVMERADRAAPDYRYVLDFLPDRDPRGGHRDVHATVRAKIIDNVGAGEFRRAGRLLFGANVEDGANIANRLQRIREQLVGIGQQVQARGAGIHVANQIKVYVVCSIAGGTGAGCLLDCLALLRHTFADNAAITALCVLPGAPLDRLVSNDERRRTMRRNAAGLLRELQAFLTGQAAPYRFEFTPRLATEIGANVPLVNGVYLVDQALHNHAPLDDFMDVCRSVGYFMYSLVGSGIGSATASDAINGPDHRPSPERCFHALGLSALEYPVEELFGYGLRFSAQKWLDRWMGMADAADAVNPRLADTKSALSMAGLDQFRDRNFSKTVPGMGFMGNPAERKEFLNKEDAEFIRTCEAKISDFMEELKKVDVGRITSELQAFGTKAAQVIPENFLAALSHSPASAKRFLAQLSTSVEDLSRKHQARMQDLQGKSAKIRNIKDISKVRIERLGPAFLDKLFDFLPWFGGRDDLLKCVTDLLEKEYEITVMRRVGDAINELRKHIRNLTASLGNLIDETASRQSENKAWLLSKDNATIRHRQVQWAIPLGTWRQWAEWVDVPIPEDVSIRSADWDGLRLAVFDQLGQGYLAHIAGFNLLHQAQADTDVGKAILAQVRALDAAVSPMIEFHAGGPSEAELGALKLVAAHHIENGENRPLVEGNFRAIGGADVTRVDISNPHLVLCTEMMHYYDIGSWINFERVHERYLEDPWWSHIFHETDRWPDLAPIPEADKAPLRDIALGLMTGAIKERADGLYVNLQPTPDLKSFNYVTYQAEPSKPVQDILDLKLAQMPPKDRLDSPEELLLGKDFRRAVQELQRRSKPHTQNLGSYIQRLVGRCVQAGGASLWRTRIEEFGAQLDGRASAQPAAHGRVFQQMASLVREHGANLRA